MRNVFRILLGAGIILSLAGCQKGTTHGDLEGKAIRFNAKSGSVATRTSFSGEGQQSGTDDFGRKILTFERINWEVGDAILIASDKATLYGDSDTKYATYTVAKVTANGDISEAELDEKAGSEELFFNENEKYAFWGIYPASAGKGEDLVEAKANYTISGSQAPTGTPTTTSVTAGEVTKTLTTLGTDMSQAVVLAAAENQTKESVVMDFYPGFTAFEFTLNSALADITLKELVLTTVDENKSLAGNVAASIQTGKNGTTFVNTYPSDKKLTYTFPENTKITKTDYVTFTVFALPEDIKGLILEFHLGADGSEIQTARLRKLIDNVPTDITFDKCKKHCLRGIAVKGGWTFKYLTLDIDVMEWEDLESDISSGDGVQATQFNIKGADNLRELKDAAVDADTSMSDTEKAAAKEANKAYRQYWVFPAGQEVTVTYKIMMPLVGTWKVEPLGDTDAFTVTSSTGALTGNLAGATASATYITLTITGTGTAQKSLYLKTTVTSNGETNNLDSETQLYDMRGYHYFVVNGNVDTE